MFVLDDAPLQLVRLTGYLELIADRITVDLVTVRSYQVGDTHILLPQRVDPERLPEAPPAQSSPASQSSVSVTAGSEDFREAISGVADESQSVLLHKCADWADKLAEEGLCRLHTAVGNKNASLQPRLLDRQVSIANPLSKSGNAYLRIHESVISKQAPAALSAVKAARKEENTTKDTKEITDQLLDALTEAYREAAGKK